MGTLFYVLIITISSLSSSSHAELNHDSLVLFKNCKFNKIFQFGDSLSDTGNIAREDPNEPCAKMPYGSMSNFSKPTGRCSNGLLMIDFIGIMLMYLDFCFFHFTCTSSFNALNLSVVLSYLDVIYYFV